MQDKELFLIEPGASNYDVIGPEAEGEEKECDVNGMAVEGPRLNGHHEGPQHGVDSEGGDDEQPVHPVHCGELVHQGLQLARAHLAQDLE